MKKLPKRIGIRGKIIFSVLMFLVAFFIIDAVISYNIFLGGFKTIEKEDIVSDVQRVEALINNEINKAKGKNSVKMKIAPIISTILLRPL